MACVAKKISTVVVVVDHHVEMSYFRVKGLGQCLLIADGEEIKRMYVE